MFFCQERENLISSDGIAKLDIEKRFKVVTGMPEALHIH